MNIKDYILRVRKETNTSTHQIADEDILYYMNRVRNNLANEIIRKVNENFFYEIFTVDLNEGQNEYSLQESLSDQEGMKKILSIDVKPKEDGRYRKIKKRSSNDMRMSLEQLWKIPESNMFFDILDSSIFLFPMPKENVKDGIMGQAIVSIKDLTIESDEKDIFPGHTDLRDYYELIYLGAKGYCRGQKQQFQEKQMEEAEFEKLQKQMLQQLTNRKDGTSEFTAPHSLDHYKY